VNGSDGTCSVQISIIDITVQAMLLLSNISLVPLKPCQFCFPTAAHQHLTDLEKEKQWTSLGLAIGHHL
jgi:hypothetical protein